MECEPDALILEGGSLRSSFSAGILDVFLAFDYRPFKRIIGVSSGAMALSFYAANQPRAFISIARNLVGDPGFIDFKSAFSAQGIMNLEYLQKYANRHFPLDEPEAERRFSEADLRVVATHFEEGTPIYLRPRPGTWQRYLLASATLPFVTRGKVQVEGTWMFDGGYADPIPVREATKRGSQFPLIIRTRPAAARVDQSYLDWFGVYWHRDQPALARLFAQWHDAYNGLADEIETHVAEGHWIQLAPPEQLASDGFSVTRSDVDADYRLGLETGLDYLRSRGFIH